MRKIIEEIDNIALRNMLLEALSYQDVITRLRLAAADKKLVRIRYDQVTRLVEPYSYRTSKKTNKLLFYGWELRREGINTGMIKAYRVDRIKDVEILDQTFQPRYQVEI